MSDRQELVLVGRDECGYKKVTLMCLVMMAQLRIAL